MALPIKRSLNRIVLPESTTSCATSPVSIPFAMSESGYLREVTVTTCGATTGTITAAVGLNGGSDLTSGGLTVAAGSGYTPSTYVFPLSGANAVAVNQGDVVTISFSGGTGSSIPAAVTLVVAK